MSVAIAGVLLSTRAMGELARLRLQYSKLGQWLDKLSDDIVDNVS